jgi:AcrR family transcriptional regulator
VSTSHHIEKAVEEAVEEPVEGAPAARTRGDDPVRAALLDAARRVLASDGPDALTVRRIATEAGMSTMNLYSRFGGKDGVVDELFVEGFEQLRASMEAVVLTDDPVTDLRTAGGAYRRFALANPTSYAVMFQRPIPEFQPSPRSMEGTLGVLADHVGRAMAAGALTPGDPFTTAAIMWANCHGLVSLELSDTAPEGVVWSDVYGTSLATMLRGLGAAEAGADR